MDGMMRINYKTYSLFVFSIILFFSQNDFLYSQSNIENKNNKKHVHVSLSLGYGPIRTSNLEIKNSTGILTSILLEKSNNSKTDWGLSFMYYKADNIFIIQQIYGRYRKAFTIGPIFRYLLVNGIVKIKLVSGLNYARYRTYQYSLTEENQEHTITGRAHYFGLIIGGDIEFPIYQKLTLKLSARTHLDLLPNIYNYLDVDHSGLFFGLAYSL